MQPRDFESCSVVHMVERARRVQLLHFHAQTAFPRQQRCSQQQEQSSIFVVFGTNAVWFVSYATGGKVSNHKYPSTFRIALASVSQGSLPKSLSGAVVSLTAVKHISDIDLARCVLQSFGSAFKTSAVIPSEPVLSTFRVLNSLWNLFFNTKHPGSPKR